MFTGIIRGIGRVSDIKKLQGLIKFSVTADAACLAGLQKGASIAVDGVCLTVVAFDATTVWFDAIAETLKRTTLESLKKGQKVNIERAARLGDEIGGHLLSGHIFGTATAQSVKKTKNNCILTLLGPSKWMKYIFPKGYIALNGASLTIVNVDKKKSTFSVHLIPETLQATTFGTIKAGDKVNLEFDTQTQVIVDTIEKIYASKSTS